MQKGVVISLLILILILGTGVLLFYKNNEKPNNIPANNLVYADLQLNLVVDYLESCRNSMNLTDAEKQLLNEDLKYCIGEGSEYIPSLTEINKLKVIQSIQGTQVCYIPGTGYGIENCSFPELNLDSCIKKFNISYKRLITRPHSYDISIFECSDANYLLRKQVLIAGPPRVTIDKIILDDNKIIQSL